MKSHDMYIIIMLLDGDVVAASDGDFSNRYSGNIPSGTCFSSLDVSLFSIDYQFFMY